MSVVQKVIGSIPASSSLHVGGSLGRTQTNLPLMNIQVIEKVYVLICV